MLRGGLHLEIAAVAAQSIRIGDSAEAKREGRGPSRAGSGK
jgi:hypothetical protein